MSLIPSETFSVASKPIKTVSLPSEAYVLSLVSSASFYAAAASAPTNVIHLFDKSRLNEVQSLPGHDGGVTTLISSPKFANGSASVLISSGKDGCVKVWDERVGSMGHAMTLATAGRAPALLSCDVKADGMLVAAGTERRGEDASILYWDPRSPAAPLRTHGATHSDDITKIQFQRNSEYAPPTVEALLSASSDGLICTNNAQEDDEDEAGLYVGNWGCSVAQAGWTYSHDSAPRIWASSDMETFSVWSAEFDRLQDVDIRQPSVHNQNVTWVTDYLIGCHNYSTALPDSDNELCVFAGSNEGDIALLTKTALGDANVPWSLHKTWTHGHVGVVRSILWDEKNNILLTGGEDSKLNVWLSPDISSSTDYNGSHSRRDSLYDEMDVDEAHVPARKRRRS